MSEGCEYLRESWGNGQLALTTQHHALDTEVPSLDDLTASQVEVEGLSAGVLVKDLAVGQATNVTHTDLLARLGGGTSSNLDILNDQAVGEDLLVVLLGLLLLDLLLGGLLLGLFLLGGLLLGSLLLGSLLLRGLLLRGLLLGLLDLLLLLGDRGLLDLGNALGTLGDDHGLLLLLLLILLIGDILIEILAILIIVLIAIEVHVLVFREVVSREVDNAIEKSKKM